MISAAPTPADTTCRDVRVTVGEGFVATAGILRSPDDRFDLDPIESLSAAIAASDSDDRRRAVCSGTAGRRTPDFTGGMT